MLLDNDIKSPDKNIQLIYHILSGSGLLYGLTTVHFVKLVHPITSLVLLVASLGITFFAEQLNVLWIP